FRYCCRFRTIAAVVAAWPGPPAVAGALCAVRRAGQPESRVAGVALAGDAVEPAGGVPADAAARTQVAGGGQSSSFRRSGRRTGGRLPAVARAASGPRAIAQPRVAARPARPWAPGAAAGRPP